MKDAIVIIERRKINECFRKHQIMLILKLI